MQTQNKHCFYVTSEVQVQLSTELFQRMWTTRMEQLHYGIQIQILHTKEDTSNCVKNNHIIHISNLCFHWPLQRNIAYLKTCTTQGHAHPIFSSISVFLLRKKDGSFRIIPANVSVETNILGYYLDNSGQSFRWNLSFLKKDNPREILRLMPTETHIILADCAWKG